MLVTSAAQKVWCHPMFRRNVEHNAPMHTSRIWRAMAAMCGSSMVIQLYTYQLMLSVMTKSPALLAEVAHNMAPLLVFLGPPAEGGTAGDPQEFVEPELWRIQQLLLFIVSPTIWISLGA